MLYRKRNTLFEYVYLIIFVALRKSNVKHTYRPFHVTYNVISKCISLQNLPVFAPSCAVDEVAVLGFANVLAWDRQMNFAPDDFTPKPMVSSDGLPPLRKTKYT